MHAAFEEAAKFEMEKRCNKQKNWNVKAFWEILSETFWRIPVAGAYLGGGGVNPPFSEKVLQFSRVFFEEKIPKPP